MDRKRRFSRLGGKLVGASLAGLVLAFVLYYLIYGLAVPWRSEERRGGKECRR